MFLQGVVGRDLKKFGKVTVALRRNKSDYGLKGGRGAILAQDTPFMMKKRMLLNNMYNIIPFLSIRKINIYFYVYMYKRKFLRWI